MFQQSWENWKLWLSWHWVSIWNLCCHMFGVFHSYSKQFELPKHFDICFALSKKTFVFPLYRSKWTRWDNRIKWSSSNRAGRTYISDLAWVVWVFQIHSLLHVWFLEFMPNNFYTCFALSQILLYILCTGCNTLNGAIPTELGNLELTYLDIGEYFVVYDYHKAALLFFMKSWHCQSPNCFLKRTITVLENFQQSWENLYLWLGLDWVSLSNLQFVTCLVPRIHA